jgi:hypothetical protein
MARARRRFERAVANHPLLFSDLGRWRPARWWVSSVTTVPGILAGAKPELRRIWRRALRDGVYAGRNAAGLKKPREEDFVLGIILAAIGPIDAELRTLLAPHSLDVAVSGVFCHGTPTYVDFRDPVTGAEGSCELGDLLVAVHYRGDGGDTLNALLLQAKKDKQAPDDSDDQWTLYNSWPPFRWKHAPHHDRRPRPRSPHDGAQYALLWSNARKAPKSHAAHPGAVARPLHYELADLLLLRAGRTFKNREWARGEGGAGWSEVIWDILDDVAVKTGTRNGTSFGRSSGSMLVRPRGSRIPVALHDGGLATGAVAPRTLQAADVEVGPEPHYLFGVDDELWFVGSDGDNEPPHLVVERRSDEEDASGVSAIVIEIDARSPDTRERPD